MHYLLVASVILTSYLSNSLFSMITPSCNRSAEQRAVELVDALSMIDLKDPEVIFQYEQRFNRASRPFVSTIRQLLETGLGKPAYMVPLQSQDLAFCFDHQHQRMFFLQDNTIFAHDLLYPSQQIPRVIDRTATSFNRSSKIAFDHKNQVLAVSLSAEYNEKFLLFFQENRLRGKWEKIQWIAFDSSSLENIFFDAVTNRCFVISTSGGHKECRIFKWIDGLYHLQQTLDLGTAFRANNQNLVYFNDKAQLLISACISQNPYPQPSISLYNYHSETDQYMLFQQISPHHDDAVITAINYNQDTKELFVACEFNQEFSRVERWELIDGKFNAARHKNIEYPWKEDTFIKKIIFNKNSTLISVYCPVDHENGVIQTRSIQTGKYKGSYRCRANDVWADDECLYKIIKYRDNCRQIRIYDRYVLHMWDDGKLTALTLSQLILLWAIKQQLVQNADLNCCLPINEVYADDYQQIIHLLKIVEIDQIRFTSSFR